MATQNFINECKNRANANRLAKFNIDNLLLNQSNYISKIELKDSCYVNDTIIGSTYTKSADVNVLNLPLNTELVGKIISPQIGVRYSDNSEEYIEFDDYTIESINDEQTTSSTGFTAMNGSTLLDTEYICSLSFEEGETHTIKDFYDDACDQLGLTPTDNTFDNYDIVLEGNPFTNKESIRVVISEVEKVSCSIAKFDWKNATISLTWLSGQIDYEFNTSDYSTLEGSFAQYGPLNVIILANAQLDGENVVMQDDESIAEYGEHQIVIDSPYFLYTEALRRQAIQAIYDKLDGLTYYDIKLTTPYGKPFLEIGDKIRINTNEGKTYDTYVLTHTFTYDGAFQSIIESPALTSEEQTVKNNMQQSSIKEKMQRTEVIVNKVTGEITAINDKVTVVEDGLGNTYSKEETNNLIATASTGLTNTFSEAGGNNIFRNTGLFFENNGNDSATNPYEYWYGIVARTGETKASNQNALLLQNGTVYQEQVVPNGNYTISFKYKKLIALSNLSVTINDEVIVLDQVNDTEFIKVIEVTSQHINIKFTSDIDNGCEIYDLMVNAGGVKLAYSQNQNETTTDTVNISKGIEVTSSETNTRFRADSDGIRVINKNSDEIKTEFTDKGMETKEATITSRATIVKTLFQEVGNHTWITRL